MTDLIAVHVPRTPFTFHLHPTWHKWLTDADLLGQRFNRTMELLCWEMSHNEEEMWPSPDRWLRVFENDPEQIRVVILGQDPYPTPHRATGYSFEIAGEADDSLYTIFYAIQDQYPEARIDFRSGDLSHWRNQGVMLMNTALSVCGSRPREVTRKKQRVTRNLPRSVYGTWCTFTKGAMRVLCAHQPYLVFVLWGRDASEFHTLKTAPISGDHGVIMSYHPSDLARTVKKRAEPRLKLFREVEHFKLVNALLGQHGLAPVDWSNLPPLRNTVDA